MGRSRADDDMDIRVCAKEAGPLPADVLTTFSTACCGVSSLYSDYKIAPWFANHHCGHATVWSRDKQARRIAMKTHEHKEPKIIDLGQASVETKGVAIFEQDGSGGRLNYATGMADG